MKLYKFMSGARVAVSKDSTGGNLPTSRKWQSAGELDIDATDGPRIGASSVEIVNGIQRDGYFILPGAIQSD